MNRQSEKITALYCRLAHYDNDPMDQSTAQNQMDTLSRYAEAHGFPNPQFFCDWGFRGTTHKRPEYQRMLRLVKRGKVSSLVVMDVPRLGIGYKVYGEPLLNILPRYNITLHSIKGHHIYTPQEMNELEARSKALYAFFRQEKRRGGRR